MTPRCTAVAVALVAGLCFALAGCQDQATESNGAHDLILSTPPAGFQLSLDHLQTTDAASGATPADPSKTANQLRGDAMEASWARTWVKGDEDVEILEYAFGDQFHSRDFVHFELLELSHGLGVVVAPHPTVPDSTIFMFNGKTRAKPRTVFCQGSWFVVAQYAFEVTDCASAPPYPELMAATTQSQYVLATSTLGLPSELISPSP